MELAEALKIAIDFEKKGHDIYSVASKKSKNSVTRKTFEYLAKQEAYHIKNINSYMKTENIPKTFDGDNVKETQTFFNTSIKDFEKKAQIFSSDEIRLYESAMELEQASYDFYKTQMQTSKSKEAKKFFEFLVTQENAHFALLQKTLDFLKDPENYFAKNESWMFEG